MGADLSIAKGPFNYTAKHVLTAVEQAAAGRPTGKSCAVLGLDDVYSRQISKELLQAKKHYELILHSISDGIFELTAETGIMELNIETRIIFANNNAALFLGKPETDLLSTHFVDHLHEKDYRRFQQMVHSNHDAAPMNIGKEEPLELNGRFYTMALVPFFDDEEKSFVLILHDITEQNKTEKELIQSESELAQIINAHPDGMRIVNTRHEIVRVNEAYIELIGMPHDDLIGRKCHEILPGKRCNTDRCCLDVILSGKKRFEIEEFFKRKDDSGFVCSAVTVPHRGRDGAIVGIIQTFKDISEYKRIQKDLFRAKKKAESANQAKSKVLANMSHEIRTPLNGIIGFTDMILGMDTTPKKRKFLGMIKSSSDRLLNIVNDILDFSRIEAGKLDLEKNTFNFSNTLNETLTLLNVKAKEKALRMTWQIQEEVPEYLIGDPERLTQVIVNLINNAIKFTEEGEIVITVDVREKGYETVLLHFSILDTGIGIPIDKQKAIFDAFVQADGSYSRKYGGTGLGLTITSQLVKMMGGDIWVQSGTLHHRRKDDISDKERKGSIFHFTAHFELVIPSDITYEETEGGEETRPEIRKHLHILLAEDEFINQALTIEILKQQNWRVTAVENGLEVIEALETGSFDLILMDVQMPKMDGLEATAAIRKKESDDGGRIPIIAMTAHALKGDNERCREAGMDDYVSKPIKTDELFSAIKRQLIK
jgi:PAS domain S-box-containing protein